MPFPKRKSKTAAATVAPAWHPNFRNFERLPDTKVIRTAFFVNAIAITLALLSALTLVYKEYQLHDVRRQVEDWDNQVKRDRRASDQAIALYKKFQLEAARVAEIDAFLKSRPILSQLLLRLGQTLPGNVAIDNFELRAANGQLVATVRGAPDLASGYASSYLAQLKADPLLGTWLEDVSLLTLNRNPQTGRLSAEFALKLKAGKELRK